jgi:glycosyltransferase involved in cell wall biosynthesis
MMNFSICLIAKDEANMLPHLFDSLSEFKSRGGEIVLVDTGSTDDTVKIATDFGCKVCEVGDKRCSFNQHSFP